MLPSFIYSRTMQMVKVQPFKKVHPFLSDTAIPYWKDLQPYSHCFLPLISLSFYSNCTLSLRSSMTTPYERAAPTSNPCSPPHTHTHTTCFIISIALTIRHIVFLYVIFFSFIRMTVPQGWAETYLFFHCWNSTTLKNICHIALRLDDWMDIYSDKLTQVYMSNGRQTQQKNINFLRSWVYDHVEFFKLQDDWLL